MRAAALFALLACAAGCGEDLAPPAVDPCAFPDHTRLTFQDCGYTDGVRHVAGCAIMPLDGAPGWSMPAGCIVYQGTTAEATCVSSCP